LLGIFWHHPAPEHIVSNANRLISSRILRNKAFGTLAQKRRNLWDAEDEQSFFTSCVVFLRAYSALSLRFIKSAIAVCTGLSIYFSIYHRARPQ